MLSILIPIYNYDVTSLVSALLKQFSKSDIPFEILCFDNDSEEFYQNQNMQINTWPNSTYKLLKKNVGRSRIRNLLADEALYDWLLFLDADVLPVSQFFLDKYISLIKNTGLDNKTLTAYGGIKYYDKKPSKNRILRWIYGKDREEIDINERLQHPDQYFSSANFLINKLFFNKFRFDESINKYGYEDILLAYEIRRKGFDIDQLDNPVYHLGLDLNEVFIEKTRKAVENIWYLNQCGKIETESQKLLRIFQKCKKYGICIILGKSYNPLKKLFVKQLTSENPSLFIYDLYKLVYLSYYSHNQ